MNIPQKPKKFINFLELPIAIIAFFIWFFVSNIAFLFAKNLIEWRYPDFSYTLALRILIMVILYKVAADQIGKINFGFKKVKDRMEKAIKEKTAMVSEADREQVKRMTESLNSLLGMVFDHDKCTRYFTIGAMIMIGVMVLGYF